MTAGRLSLLCVVFVLALPVSSAGADTFTVTTTADTTNGSCAATCSLRDAVIAANASDATADVITVPAGTYRLTQGTSLAVGSLTSNDVTINGAGARSTIIEGTGAERLFTAGQLLIGDDADGERTAAHRGQCRAGRGRRPRVGRSGLPAGRDPQRHALRHQSATPRRRRAPGSRVAHTGGTAGTVNVTASQISGNTVGGAASPGTASGGGIFSQYTVNLINSTVSGNVAQTTVQAQGGGIAMLGGTLSLVNTTVAGNAARGGGDEPWAEASSRSARPPPPTPSSPATCSAPAAPTHRATAPRPSPGPWPTTSPATPAAGSPPPTAGSRAPIPSWARCWTTAAPPTRASRPRRARR